MLWDPRLAEAEDPGQVEFGYPKGGGHGSTIPADPIALCSSDGSISIGAAGSSIGQELEPVVVDEVHEVAPVGGGQRQVPRQTAGCDPGVGRRTWAATLSSLGRDATPISAR